MTVSHRVVYVECGDETYTFVDVPEGDLKIYEHEVQAHSMAVPENGSPVSGSTDVSTASSEGGFEEIYPGDRTWRDL